MYVARAEPPPVNYVWNTPAPATWMELSTIHPVTLRRAQTTMIMQYLSIDALIAAKTRLLANDAAFTTRRDRAFAKYMYHRTVGTLDTYAWNKYTVYAQLTRDNTADISVVIDLINIRIQGMIQCQQMQH